MVPKVGFRHNDWLEVGWSLFKLLEVQDRDFWMFELTRNLSLTSARRFTSAQ